MSLTVRELTEPFEFEAATRRFTVDLDEHHQIQFTALNLTNRQMYDEEPLLQMAGEVATNNALAIAFLNLAQRLINTPGSNLPSS